MKEKNLIGQVYMHIHSAYLLITQIKLKVARLLRNKPLLCLIMEPCQSQMIIIEQKMLRK